MSYTQEAVIRIAARWRLSLQIVRFLVVGGIVTLTELGLLYTFTQFLGIWYLFSLVLAFCVAFVVSFALQKFWTFRDVETAGMHIQASAYLLVALANLIVNAALLYALVQYAGVWYMHAQVLISALIACASFLIYKFAIFKSGHGRPDLGQAS